MNPYRMNMFQSQRETRRRTLSASYKADFSGVDFFIISGAAVIFMIAAYLILGENYPSTF